MVTEMSSSLAIIERLRIDGYGQLCTLWMNTEAQYQLRVFVILAIKDELCQEWHKVKDNKLGRPG